MSSTTNAAGAINRITKEIANIHKGSDLSLAVACRDDDVRHLRALIVGPPDTPYEFGFFELSVKFPREYPIKSPTVTCITTNGGQTRFNPNIYAQGKVCLSILGTWPGEKGEGWSSAQGLESVLLSIQSLMSPNPWENEPGEEDGKITDAERARRLKEGLCMYCGGKGHQAADCKKRTTPSQGRASATTPNSEATPSTESKK